MEQGLNNWYYWQLYRDIAIRNGWEDYHRYSDPVLRDMRWPHKKAYYRRLFNPEMLKAVFGDSLYKIDREVEGTLVTGIYPRWMAVSMEAWCMMMARDEESIPKFMYEQALLAQRDVQPPLPDTDGSGEVAVTRAENRASSQKQVVDSLQRASGNPDVSISNLVR